MNDIEETAEGLGEQGLATLAYILVKRARDIPAPMAVELKRAMRDINMHSGKWKEGAEDE